MDLSTVINYMREAIECARAHQTSYGALIAEPGRALKVVTANSTRRDQDPTAHAEINAIREASRQGLHLSESVLISTCEPCPMCAMAAVWAGIGAIYFGASIDDANRFGHQVPIYCRDIAQHAWYELEVRGNVLREDCIRLFNQK